MPIANISVNRGFLASLTGGINPTIDLPTGNAIAVGNVLILVAVYDNSGTAGVDPNMSVVSNTTASQIYGQDLRGNLWFRLAKAVRSSGGANDGSVADIWACFVTNSYLASDDITLQFSFPAVVTLAQISEWSGINPRSYSVVTATTGTGNGTSITAPAIAPTTTGQMVVAVGGIETNTLITGDSDTTNGSWVALTNLPGNTGTDATSQVAFSQYKIVTAPGAQNWTATKVGASDWAALAVVFDAFTDVADGFVSGNPNYPCIAGAEILPLGDTYLPVDTGTEYFQTHEIFPNSFGTQQYNVGAQFNFDPTGSGASYAHHGVIHEIFPAGAEVVVDEPRTEIYGLNSVTLGSGATVSSGTAVVALENVGGEYVTLPNGGYADIRFNMTFLTNDYPGYRVVNWGIRYLAWKDDSAAPGPGEGIIAEWRDDSANNGAGAAADISAWLVQNYKRDVQFETRSIGEVNPIIRGKGEIFAQNAPYNAAFTVNDLGHMTTGTASLRVYGAQGQDPSQSTVYLDYIEAFVTLVPDRRLAHGSRLVSNAPTFSSTTYFSDPFSVTQMWSFTDTSVRWQVPASAGPYVVGTREAVPASPADYWANQAFVAAGQVGRTIGYNEAIGPSFLLPAIEQPRATLENPTLTGQPVLTRGVISGGVLASPPEELDNFIIGAAGLDLVRFELDGSFWPAYWVGGDLGFASQAYSGKTCTAQINVDGTTTFDRVKVLVYPDELTTANLTITVEQPSLTVLATATITVAQALAFPDLGNGWREISVVLNVAVTPAAGPVFIRMASATSSAAPWYCSVTFPLGNQDEFNYNSTLSSRNRAAVLQCELDNPSVSVGTEAQSLLDSAGTCLDNTTINLPELTFTNGADYDQISIERSVDGGTTYVPVDLITIGDGGTYIDAGVPWDLPALTVTYRITGYRDADHLNVVTITSGWNNVATHPAMLFGLANDETLWVYAPVTETSLEVQWNPLNPLSIVPLFGVDYQIPLRAPEERGLETSFLILVNHLNMCGAGTGEATLTGSLSPEPYDALRALAREERFQLVLPGGYSKFVTLSLGAMTIKTPAGIFLAEATLTDITEPPVVPYSDTTV